jgi:hypothetical protein
MGTWEISGWAAARDHSASPQSQCSLSLAGFRVRQDVDGSKPPHLSCAFGGHEGVSVQPPPPGTTAQHNNERVWGLRASVHLPYYLCPTLTQPQEDILIPDLELKTWHGATWEEPQEVMCTMAVETQVA